MLVIHVIFMTFCQLLIAVHCYLKMLPMREGSKSLFVEINMILLKNYFLFYIQSISKTRKYITVHSQRIQSPSKYHQINFNYNLNMTLKSLIKQNSFLSCSGRL